MAYNKARAEKEWLTWKNAEEAKLRELGVDEDTIGLLHVFDWAVFNSDRRFYEPQGDWTAQTDWDNAHWMHLPVRDGNSLLDEIEDQRLFSLLSQESRTTLEILYLKLCGFSSKEIGEKLNLSPVAVDLRLTRLRKKVQKKFRP